MALTGGPDSDGLTRAYAAPRIAPVRTWNARTVTVAPIATTVRGLSSDVGVDAANGLAEPSVVSCDNITTIPADAVGEQIGVLLDTQEPALSQAIMAAFDLG